MTQPSQNVTFTMKIDASDLRRLFGSQGGNGTIGGPAAQALGAAPPSPTGGDRGAKPQALVKSFALLGIMGVALTGILRNSAMANTYMGAMGKMFGAALDILMIPLIPLFNLLMVGISKLIMWLIQSGYLEKMTKLMQKVADNIVGILKWVREVWMAIKSFDMAKLAGLIKDAVVNVVKDPSGAAATVAVTAAGYALLRTVPVIGGLMKVGEKVVGGLGKTIFRLGRGAAGAAGAAGGAGGAAGGVGGAGGAAGAGAMGTLGIVAGAAALGIGAMWGTNALLAKTGLAKKGSMKSDVLSGAAGGAAAGAVIGSAFFGIGAAPGAAIGAGLGAGAGWLKHKMFSGGGQKEGVGNGMSMVNSNNTINFTQNNVFNGGGGDMQGAVNMAIEQMEKRTGFALAGHSTAQGPRSSVLNPYGSGISKGNGIWNAAKATGRYIDKVIPG